MLGKMIHADKIRHPQHFWTNLTDIRMRINPKIRIQIPDLFWLKFWHWPRFALSECFCYHCCDVMVFVTVTHNSMENGYSYRYETYMMDCIVIMLLHLQGGSILNFAVPGITL